MPIDNSIYQLAGRGVKSVQDYDNEALQYQTNRLAAQMGQAKLQDYQNQENEKNALRSYIGGGVDLSTPEGQAGLYKAAPTMAPGVMKTFQDQLATKAQALKDTGQANEANARAAKSTYDLQIEKANRAISDISAMSSPQDALESIQHHLQAGDIDAQKAQQMVSSIPQDPTQFPEWRKSTLMRLLDAKTQLEMTKPQVQYENSGASKVAVNTNAYAPGGVGPVAGVAPIKMTATPGEVLQANTSRANNRDTIAAENLRAGVNPDGSVSPDMETTAKAIANGQLPAPTGMALLNPKNQRILARVMEINPQYDATTVAAKKKAASDFTTGTLGNSMRSFATAVAHLDTLGQLVDALDNGNVQVVNKLGNYIGEQTGSTAPTNFDAAKDVVGKEVVKAIVAGGGGVAEREELAKRLDNAKSPAQLKGVIKTYSELMKAQHDNLLIQRRAAGLPDSTLPDYSKTSGASGDAGSAVPSDIQAILNKHGGK